MGALETLREGAERLATAPSDPAAIASLEQLFETPDRFEAARLLVSAHERAGNDQGLIRALEVLSEAPGEVAEQLASLTRMAEIQRHKLEQPDLALATLVKGLQRHPGDLTLHRIAEGAAVEADSVDVLVDLLGELLEGAEGPARAAIHKQLGGLHARHLPDSGAAIEHLQQALAEWPEDLEILEGLRRQHEKRQGWAALAEVTEKIARLEPDRARQMVAWRSAATLHEARLHDEESALECWLRVLELSSGAREAAEQVRRLLAAVPGHERARAALDRLAPPPPTGPTPSDLLAALQAFVTPGADRVRALPELRRLAQQVDALDSLAEVVESESDKVEDPAELTSLLRFAALLREELKQPRPAIVVWNDLLAVRPDDPEALERLSVLLRAEGDLKNAAEVALRRARLLPPGPDRLALFADAADFFLLAECPDPALQSLDEALAAAPSADSGALGPIQVRRGKALERRDPASAMEVYTRLLQDPRIGPEAVAGLERLLAVPAVRAAAGAALEPSLRQLGDPRRLVEALEAQLETVALTSRRLRLVEIARLWELAKEPRAALGAQLRAFHLAPSNARLRADLERLAAGLDARDELLAAYEEALERGPKGEAAALWRRVAELRLELGQRDRAMEAWDRAAEAAPQDPELLSAYMAACRAQEDLPRLAGALRRQIDALPGSPARTELLYELADLCEDSLADPAGAVRAFQELLSHAPEDRAVLKSLQRLYEKTGDTRGLKEVLARDLELARKAGSDEADALALRLDTLGGGQQQERAELLLQQARAQLTADAPALAAATFAELLAVAPDEPRAIAQLVALVADPRASATALQLLESAFKGPKQEWQRIAVLELLVASKSPEEGRAQRVELAALQETQGDLRQAFAWRLRLLAEDPGAHWPPVEAERLAQAAHLEEELAGAYQDLLERVPRGLIPLGATDRALPIFESVLESTGRLDELSDLLSGRLHAARAAGDQALERSLAERLERAGRRG